MRDDVHARRIDAQLAPQALAPMLGVDDDRVEAVIQTPLGGALARAGLAWHDVVSGEHKRATGTGRGATGRQQMHVEVLDRQPLEVHHVGVAGGATVAQHVGHVLGELRRRPQTRSGTPDRGAVEQLAPHIPVGGRHRAVGEAARDERDLGAGAAKRAAQRMVVRGRVGRGVDDVDAHARDNRRVDREIELTYCVVNTSQRELLLRGLDAIARERDSASLPFATEVLVLDNGSRDGSAEAARAHPAVDEVIALEQRRGKAANDSELLRRARGRYALLLNEDSELAPGATLALWQALEAHPDAACAGAQLLRPDGTRQACAWRFPTPWTALAGALMLHRWVTVQSRGARTREVDWCQSSALLVRRERGRARSDYLDPDFFVYSDEVDFARRLRDAGCSSLYVPAARAIHHEQLSTSTVPERRIVEMARNRDLYMRKHHSPAAARAVRWLTAWSYSLRALAALVLPGRSPRRYWRHVTATLSPSAAKGCARPRTPTTARHSRRREDAHKSLRGSSAYASTSPCPARNAATRRRPSATSALACSRSWGLTKRVAASSAGTSASHTIRNARPAIPLAGSSSSPETATAMRIAVS